MDKMQYAEKIRNLYTEKQPGKLEELRALDKKAKRPATVFAWIFGTVGALVLGVGMCLAMGVIGNLMPLGIVVGIAGIAMVSLNYPAYKAILGKGRRKYADRILSLSGELLHE